MREDQSIVKVKAFDASGAATINIADNDGIFMTLDGGDIDSSSSAYKPGGMAAKVPLGGSRTTDNLTLEKVYTIVDHNNYRSVLENGVGSLRVQVSDQPLTTAAAAQGTPKVWVGILKKYTPPKYNSEGEDAKKFQIEIVPEG